MLTADRNFHNIAMLPPETPARARVKSDATGGGHFSGMPYSRDSATMRSENGDPK
jgi:hypothetical protein